MDSLRLKTAKSFLVPFLIAACLLAVSWGVFPGQAQAAFAIQRPVIMVNGELISDKCFVGKDTITAGCKVVERDTSIVVNEASDDQWSQVEIAY